MKAGGEAKGKGARAHGSWQIKGFKSGDSSTIHERFLKSRTQQADGGAAEWDERRKMERSEYHKRPDLFYTDMIQYDGDANEYLVCTVCHAVNSHQAHKCPTCAPDYVKPDRRDGGKKKKPKYK